MSQQARDRLVESAARLFRRQGYAATGVKQLLDDSGTVAGSLYHHFPGGKEQVAVAVVEKAGQEVGTALKALLDRSDDVNAALDRWITRLIHALDASDGLDGCPIAPLALEAPTASGPLQRAAAAQFTAWATTLSTALRDEGHPADDADRLGLVLLSAIEGALLLSRTSGDPAALQAVRVTITTLLTR
ncbi:TetR/AcrR family transcriptional regulator [Streptomyces sp. NRRL B-24085]|uniref:TetR/AcrR family transcriptional regulator n=1 Tax=Streptomyces sp. NRRL B-24085 TaxID=1709476 RepID=UPI0006B3B1D7|nr:TetR/AcrR family transcriptional regulator [Streptomyces sp. NRRL B-24085]